MRTLTLVSALLVASVPLLGVPTASAQVEPDIPYVPYLPGRTTLPTGHQMDTNPTDGWTHCDRMIGVKVCLAIDRSDCFLWFSAGTGGCFID